MSHYYASRIARMPLPPTRGGQFTFHEDYREASPFPDYLYKETHRHRRRSLHGAEDAAHELERSVLGDLNDAPTTRMLKAPGNPREAKRSPSDAGGDFPVEMELGPASKRRKCDIEDNCHDSADLFPAPSNLSDNRGKGRPRDASPDSISVKPSRKKVPRKRLGSELEPEWESASHPQPISGDATPAIFISQPPSPAPTMPSIIYELEEEIPPLKKAKKVDEPTMIKRIKTLEEAQRKVWTNIARRDIAKVFNERSHNFYPCLTYRTLGLQVPALRVPGKAVADGTHCQSCFAASPTTIHENCEGYQRHSS